jgi:hypothetical protein
MVGVARGAGNDSTQGAQGTHDLLQNVEALRGHTVKLYQDNQAVCGALLLDVVYIRRESNLADARSRQRVLDMWSLQLPTQQELLHLVESTLGSPVCTDPFAYSQSAVAPKFATPLHCRHSAVFNGLILDWSSPVTLWVNPTCHLLTQVLENLRASRVKGILIYPYWPLQPWFQEVQQLSVAHFLLSPQRLYVRPHHFGMVEPFVNREVQLRAVVFDCA